MKYQKGGTLLHTYFLKVLYMLKKILVNSQDRQSGTPYDFKVKLPIRNTRKIHSLMVSKAMLANTWYNVKNKAIIFKNSIDNTQFNIQITDGNYTISTLITKINDLLSTFNGGLAFHTTTLSFDTVSGTIPIWNSKASFNFDLFDASSSNSILKLLNFSGAIPIVSSATPQAFILTSSGFVNISPNNYVLIKSSALRHQETYEPETTNPNDFNNIIATVPITRNFGEAIIYENTDTENMIKYSSHIPNQIDVKLCFYNNETAFINTEWSFELVVKYE